ncbi:LppM family (lipo)protein [Brachybacterium sacelli]|uniref:LppM domain-containing protein n=1 Tax=Brachybacterium sacelli TaxID=173364 RepID=A0ABS4WV62_9MICO|nr:hypothetical protein [Brachybacterium sacelli]MBP2380091.1 hypothetical protein [Brachybacterium sacelli]
MNTISARRRLLAVLVLPFVLLLAGCGRLYADYEIQDADTMNLAFDIGFQSSYAEQQFDSAEALCEEMQAEGSSFGEVEVSAYDEDGIWGCRAEGMLERGEFGEGMELAEEGGEYHLTFDFGADQALTQEDIDVLASGYGADASAFDFRMSFTFPGKVLESAGGTVDGKTVTYTDVTELSQGVDITAESSGFPWVIVIVIVLVVGFLLLLVLAAVIFFVVRSRRAKRGPKGPGGSGPAAPAAFGGTAGAASISAGDAPPAAPQHGQPWGQAPPPPAAPQGDQGQPWSQPSPPAPQGDQGQQWGQPGSGSQDQQGWSRPPQPPGQ